MLAVCFGLSGGAASQGNSITSTVVMSQQRINEIAARFIQTHDVLNGITAARLPGEDSSMYKARIRRYFAAFDQAVKDARPLRSVPTLTIQSMENVLLWRRLSEESRRLQSEVGACYRAWERPRRIRGRSRFGPNLLRAHQTIRSILNRLRDAEA